MPTECISPKLEKIYFRCPSVRVRVIFSTVREVNLTLSWEESEEEELKEEDDEDLTIYYKMMHVSKIIS